MKQKWHIHAQSHKIIHLFVKLSLKKTDPVSVNFLNAIEFFFNETFYQYKIFLLPKSNQLNLN
jgi:hypothetical protein